MNIEDNQDIIYYIWNLIDPRDYKKMAIVSKTYNNYYKSIPYTDKLYEIYVTKNNYEFIKYIVNHIANKYNYNNNPLFIKILVKACYVININDIFDTNNIIIFNDIIEIFLHSINYKYKLLLYIINQLLYKYNNLYLDFNQYVNIMRIYLYLFNDKYIEKPSLFTEYYNKSRELIKISLMVHMFSIINISNNVEPDKLRIFKNIKNIKLNEICDTLSSNTFFSGYHPEYFKKNILKIYLNI